MPVFPENERDNHSMNHPLPESAEQVWMAVFLSRINPISGPPMRPTDAALVADEAKQAYEARAIYWAQNAPEESDDQIPRVY